MYTVNTNFIEEVNSSLKKQFGDAVIAFEVVGDMPQFTVEKEKVADILEYLFKTKELGFTFLTTLCGVHYPNQELAFAVVYHLHNLPKNQRIRIKAFAKADDIVFPTTTKVFAAANWMERETYDFFGIIFDGHPNLKRILNMDDMDYFPMRKEYPLEDATRDDKDDKMFGR